MNALVNRKWKKILVIGPGPIVIAQAAEFDYSASQCLQILKEAGIKSVIINSNPATIMTDSVMADTIYMEPLTTSFLKKIVLKERPDAVLCSFGGQTALNLGKKLWDEGFWQKYQIEILGSSIETIKAAEDRMLFRDEMQRRGHPVPHSRIITHMSQVDSAIQELGLPLIIRPAYTLGGSGGGLASTVEEVKSIMERGLRLSAVNQCLLEQSIAGLKEIEFEVICDHKGNALAVCGLENLDPVGVHTGDSVVVAPIMTLSDYEVQSLRSMSLQIVRDLKIVGACNVQLAHNSKTKQSYVIEVNPRVSRSSALASKATGYPIAKVAAWVCLGKTLDEIINPITQKTCAAFEPSLDYVVMKFPRFPFDKFIEAEKKLGPQMKATGEVMSLERNFLASFLKGIRSLEQGFDHLWCAAIEAETDDGLWDHILRPTDMRWFAVAELLRRDQKSLELIAVKSMIAPYFLRELQRMVQLEVDLKSNGINKELLLEVKKRGFADSAIARFTNEAKEKISQKRIDWNIRPVIKTVDSCAAEFPAVTPYYYLSYDKESDVNLERVNKNRKRVVVLGSGPIRIGQGIEFDYSSVHALNTCRALGHETIMINNNPETCSTDFSFSDRLYFVPLDEEDVLEVLRLEKPDGVIVQLGGQTPLNLASKLERAGFHIYGTTAESIENSENRKFFEVVLTELSIRRPKAMALDRRINFATEAMDLSYPLMVRPSFVLGGRSMAIVYDQQELEEYFNSKVYFSKEAPLLLDEYIKGKEIEVDVLSDGKDIFIPGILEHIERAGVHSGDSMGMYPPKLPSTVQQEIIHIALKLCKKLNIRGLLNIQFTWKKNQLYILEVNPRASRTVPFMAKMTKIPIAEWATKLMLGEMSVSDLKRSHGLSASEFLAPTPEWVSLKLPVFSFEKLSMVDSALGPEMKSTGEVVGRGVNFPQAMAKGLMAAGVKWSYIGSVLFTIADRFKPEIIPLVKRFHALGHDLMATAGTAAFIEKETGIKVTVVPKVGEADYHLEHYLRDARIDVVINALAGGRNANSDGHLLRKLSIEMKLPCFTSLDTAEAFLEVLEHQHFSIFES
ncbi:MAG: carbamoyl-phosphate synthase large subunit [Bacteriovoracaceae bacterium]|nr:carbamoyl-phosphate synthase large subunit [Bacteriovoracaceae bacterium]